MRIRNTQEPRRRTVGEKYAQRKQTKTKPETGSEHRARRKNRSKNDGEGTVMKRRVAYDARKTSRIRPWNVCGFATDVRRRKETAEQASNRDLDKVDIQESREKEGAEKGWKTEEYAWIGVQRKGQKIKSRRVGVVGF